MAQAKLRIEGKGATGSDTRVWLDDQEITNVTRALSLNMEVGEANTATFTVYVNEVELNGEFESTLIRANGRERTSFASRFREWLHA